MSNTTTIMVPVDFSKYSLPTAQYAVALARELNAHLLFVNVLNQLEINALKHIEATYAGFNADQLIGKNLRERQEKIEELIQNCHANRLTCRGLVRIGVPYLELLEVIDEEAPVLLIMATKGRTDLSDAVVGSCARSMFHRSPIPLLSIRGDKFFNQ